MLKMAILKSGGLIYNLLILKPSKAAHYITDCVCLFQWDEGIQKMSLGETAELRIEAEWAYGRKGLEGKYPFAQLNWYHCS